jgi:hypothetical protein
MNGILLLPLLLLGHTANADDRSPFLHDARLLAEAKQRIEKADPAALAALEKLRKSADKAMTGAAFTIVNKTKLPPSSDKHDYFSLGIYWWPNPDTPDGLPSVRHDGKVNPEVKDFDAPPKNAMTNAVYHLALAHYFTGHQPYADRAALLLRAFFLDEATRMNPNLNFGQGVPGHNTGRAAGIIETVGLATKVVDAAILLRGSEAWTAEDERGLQQWFRDYRDWLENSKIGKQEGKASNNHGMYYDVQVAVFSLYIGDNDHARAILQRVPETRIVPQIAPDGSQPEELARTKSFTYSTFNLQAMLALATLGKRLGVDLWAYTGPDGQSIPKALDYLLPYAVLDKPWPREQIKTFDPDALLRPFLRHAILYFGEERYRAPLETLGRPPQGDLIELLYPL